MTILGMNGLKSILAAVLACICLTSAAQKNQISGKVQDSDTYKVVPYANISFIGTNAGCATDVNGEFSVTIDALPVYLIISHMGYETRRIWLENASDGLNILMKPAVKMLQEVEIRSESGPEPFFKDDHYAVLDYDVDNTLVYLLIYRFRVAKSQLICKSENGDTVATSGNLPFLPTGIFADCLGYLHLLSADSAYQVYLKKDTILFPYKSEIHRFYSRMLDCVASSQDWLYFRNESIDHQRIDFYRMHRKTTKKVYFASSIDEEKMKILRSNPIDHYLLLMDTLPDSANEMAEWCFVNKILYTANKSVLEKIGDSLIVFNTVDGSLELYDLNGSFLSGLLLAIQHKRWEKWTKEIYYDAVTHLLYTSFMKNGKLLIYRIDLVSGALTFELSTSQIFAQKVRVQNNYLYYLYDTPGVGDNKQLLRQSF